MLAIESLVYGFSRDSTLNIILQNRKTTEEFLNHKDVEIFMPNIKAACSKEADASASAETEEAHGDSGSEEDDLPEVVLDMSKSPSQLRLASKKLDAETRAELDTKMSHAERRVRSIVKLVPEPETSEELVSIIKDSLAGKVRGTSKSYVIIVIDAKLLCEAGTQATWRLPPTRAQQVQKLLGAALSSRDEFPELHAADAIVAPDATKGKDWEDKIEKRIGTAKHTMSRQFISYTHNSAEESMERDHGRVLELMETALMVSKSPLSVIKRPRKALVRTVDTGQLGWPCGLCQLDRRTQDLAPAIQNQEAALWHHESTASRRCLPSRT